MAEERSLVRQTLSTSSSSIFTASVDNTVISRIHVQNYDDATDDTVTISHVPAGSGNNAKYELASSVPVNANQGLVGDGPVVLMKDDQIYASSGSSATTLFISVYGYC